MNGVESFVLVAIIIVLVVIAIMYFAGSLAPLWFASIFAVFLIVFGLLSGHLYWDSKQPQCLDRKNWISNPWVTLYSVGSLELRAHSYGCPPGESVSGGTKDGVIPSGVLNDQ